MGKNKRKYYVSEHGSIRSLKQKAFLVYWNDNDKRKHSTSSGPYTDFKEAEKTYFFKYEKFQSITSKEGVILKIENIKKK